MPGEFANGVAVTPDGRIVLAGTSQSAGRESMLIARLAAGGALDTSFGSGTGATHVDLGSTSGDEGSGVVLQPDGRIVVSGTDTAASGETALVARFTAAGALEGSFGTDGLTRIRFGTGSALGRAVALQPDGKILLAGDQPLTGGSDLFTARLQGLDGSRDSSYGSTGTTSSPFMNEGPEEFNGYAVAAAPNGDVRAAGDADAAIGDNKSDFFLVSNSSTAESGSTRGFDLGGDDHARAIAVEADGATLLAGYSSASGGYDFAVERVTNDLKPDPTFGTAGHAIIDLGGTDTAQAMAVQPDGKIVLAGSTQAPGGKPQVAVVRLQPNGSLDSTFGKGGKVIVSAPPGDRQIANAVALAPDGKIVVAGQAGSGTGSDLLVVRLLGDSGGAGGRRGRGRRRRRHRFGRSVPRCQGHKATIIGTNGGQADGNQAG